MRLSLLKRTIAPILAAFVFASCVNTTVEKTPSFDLAMAMDGPEDCPVYMKGDPGYLSGKGAIPYVAVIAFGEDGGATNEHFIEKGTKQLRKYKPDFIVVSEPTRQNVGAVHSFNGGFGMSTPVIQKQITLWGLRYTPARLGITWDSDSLMVTSIRNPGLYDAGLLEGDTLISLDGVPFPKTDSGEQTWHLRALQNRPGQEAEIIWIRPGVGRMAATVTYVVNDLHLWSAL